MKQNDHTSQIQTGSSLELSLGLIGRAREGFRYLTMVPAIQISHENRYLRILHI